MLQNSSRNLYDSSVHITFYWNSIWNFTGMLGFTSEFLFSNLWIKITGMTPEFLEEHTWVICIRNKNLLHNHSSNIHTSTARYVHELDQVARVFMGVHGFLWRFMRIYGNLWKSMGVYESMSPINTHIFPPTHKNSHKHS